MLTFWLLILNFLKHSFINKIGTGFFWLGFKKYNIIWLAHWVICFRFYLTKAVFIFEFIFCYLVYIQVMFFFFDKDEINTVIVKWYWFKLFKYKVTKPEPFTCWGWFMQLIRDWFGICSCRFSRLFLDVWLAFVFFLIVNLLLWTWRFLRYKNRASVDFDLSVFIWDESV